MPVSVSDFVSITLWSCDIRGGILKQVELNIAVFFGSAYKPKPMTSKSLVCHSVSFRKDAAGLVGTTSNFLCSVSAGLHGVQRQ